MKKPPKAARVLPADLARMKSRGEKIVFVTAYDAPSGRLADEAGVDTILVGDSAAMTILGHESTLPITIDEMLMLTRAVVRGRKHALVVADLPFGSFHISNRTTVTHAVRLVKEGGADAVKVEGAGATLGRVEALVRASIPVVGHVGLTPQSATSLGGYKAQGRTASAALRLIDDAIALEKVGCFAIVLEAIPAAVAAEITARVTVPTIGIGAGSACDGQVLVWHDLLGLTPGDTPRFVKQYANLSATIAAALEAYADDVRRGTFPDKSHIYAMHGDELERFRQGVASARGDDARKRKS
ncbi:MAG: 3-methyl-2-oxobutanoate hydroxymethyltransferase [Vicinamibacterales bacterium]